MTILQHAGARDPLTCPDCDQLPPEEANTHTLAAFLLREGASSNRPDVPGWLHAIGDLSTAAVARLQDGALWCWCGHPLHYPDCACDDDPGSLTCAKRWAVEANTPTDTGGGLVAPASWRCPGEGAEHWAKHTARVAADSWRVTCGHCGEESLISAAGDVVGA